MPQSSLRWFVLLLVVPLPLSSAPASASATQLTPHCADKQMTCFVSMKCLLPSSGDSLWETIRDTDICDAHMEIRQYSENKALVRLKSKNGIKLVYKNSPDTASPIFECGLVNGEVAASVDGKAVAEFYGDKWDSTGSVCEFLYSSTPLFDPAKFVNIIYGTGSTGGTIEGTFPNQIVQRTSQFKRCDMDWLDVAGLAEKTDKEWIYVNADRRFDQVECKDKKGQELVYLEEAGGEVEVAGGGVECDKEGTEYKYFVYKDVKSKKAKTHAITIATAPSDNDKMPAVGCRMRVCMQCKEAPPSQSQQEAPKVVKEKNCNILQCEGNRIQINEELAIIGTPTCEKHETEDSKFRWMLNNKEVTKASCASKVSCHAQTQLKLDGNAVGKGDTDIVCLDKAQIKIEATGVSPTLTDKITCDGARGIWSAHFGQDIPKDATLTCIATESTTLAPSGASMDAFLTYTAAVIGGLIIITITAIVIFCLFCKKKMQKRKNAKKIKTLASSRIDPDPGLKTALPVGFVQPPPSLPSSDPIKPPKPDPELVEKTMIATTPESKPKSVMMNTAILNTTEIPDNFGDTKDQVTDLKTLQKKSQQSDGSEPRPVRIGSNGEFITEGKKRKDGSEKSGEKSNEKSKTETKKPEPKPVDNGPKPQVFALDPKEELIRKGATVKANQYPTLAEIASDWEDFDEKKALKAGNMEAGKKKNRGKTTDRTKTVPTAVTPDVNPEGKIEQTQKTVTRNTVDKGEAAMDNLVTQLDTTVEQKEADGKKAKK